MADAVPETEQARIKPVIPAKMAFLVLRMVPSDGWSFMDRGS
ncbi:hypothetical protein ACQP2Y_41105 [Actinoplanes sp. CA-051413]